VETHQIEDLDLSIRVLVVPDDRFAGTKIEKLGFGGFDPLRAIALLVFANAFYNFGSYWSTLTTCYRIRTGVISVLDWFARIVVL
jgi:hypothetical protein